ncbi:autotransporter domain-containing protein [Devosia ginsengisoli]|uniref:autotransporter outer membrane beta-barrel domain-containing protein n=1 Tax=Devosia ginsengisoli TaxID=400770 RepID=UPI0026EDBEB3|nr:autotransporter domain-containing protein [Devosia ginsengisoli]MCR6670401.1 autotransporter domain-containing protein [Devosia ginsengisoli]
MVDRTSAPFAAAGAALFGRRVLLCGISTLALALVCAPPTPALAQMITQGGGNGGNGAANGGAGGSGIAGGGGGGGSTLNGAGGAGGHNGTPGAEGSPFGTNVGGAGGAAGNVYGGGGGGGGGGGFSNGGGDGGDGADSMVNSTDIDLTTDLMGLGGGAGVLGSSNSGSGGGGGGAAGLVLTGAGVTATTEGFDILGGTGGEGGGNVGGGGGGGGAGLVLMNGGTISVSGGSSMLGGAGGTRGGGGGGGGSGGAGLFLYDGGSLNIQAGAVGGGNGGTWIGGAGGSGSGGDGGAGVLSNGGIIDNGVAGTIIGGSGGSAFSGRYIGGSGGAGIRAWGGSVTNAGIVSGGIAASGFYGGAGGVGIVFQNGQTASLTNTGTVNGGDGADTNNFDPLLVGVPGSGGAGIVGAATGGITVINGGVVAGGLSGDGIRANAITFGGDGNRLELLGGFSFTGDVVAGGGSNNVLALGGTANAGFDLAQIGAAAQFQDFTDFEKTGAGTWTLTGSSAFTGPTSVNQGTLLVNGDLTASAVAVNAGARLGGEGALGAVRVASGGTLAPGNSIGLINVLTLTYNAGAIHEVELAAGGNAPTIHNDVTGAFGLVDIDPGAILHVTPANSGDTGETYTPGLTYTIIISNSGAAQGVVGRFGTVTDDYLYLDFTDSYDSHHVYLTSRLPGAVNFCLTGFTVNQCAAAGGAQSLGSGTLFNAIANLTDKDGAAAAFDMLSGEIHASGQTVLIDSSHFVSDAINEHIRASFAALGRQDVLPLAYAGSGGNAASSAIGGALAPTPAERFAAWGSAFGAWGHADGDGNAAGLDSATGGMVAGIDGLVTDTVRLGVVAAYSRSGFDAADRASSGHADTYHLGAYGGTEIGALGIRGGATYGWSHIDTTRTVAFPGFTDTLNAGYGAGLFQAFGEVSYRFDTPSAVFEPFANLTHVSLQTDGYTETGGAAALTSAGQTTNATFATLGVRASTVFELGGVAAQAHGTLGWQHAFGDTVPTATHALAGGNAFSVAGSPIARDAAIVEAGLDFTFAPNATLGFSYNGRFGGGAYENGARASLSVKF